MGVKSGNSDRDHPNPRPESQRVEIATLLFTDMVGSTRLKEKLGSQKAVELIHSHDALIRQLILEFPDAFEVDNAGDGFFLAFRRVSDAVQFALLMQGRLRAWNRQNRQNVLDRVGIHIGEVIVEGDIGSGQPKRLRGLEVDKCARVMGLAGGNQILLTRFAFDNARGMLKGHSIPGVSQIRWIKHGHYALKGVAEPVEICEVGQIGLAALKPPPDSEKAKRVEWESAAEEIEVDRDGWSLWWHRFAIGSRFDRRLAIWGGIITAVAGIVTLPLVGDASYDFAYLFRPFEVPGKAVIVRMDRDAHDQLGQHWMQPWDRRVHGALIDKMREFGARAVVFDVLFDVPADDPQQDVALVAAAKRFGKVAVGGMETRIQNPAFIGRRVEGPFHELREVTHWGFWGVVPDGSDFIRRSTRRAGDTLETKIAQMVGAGIAAQPTGSRWLNYYGPPGTIDQFSYSDVLSNRIAAANFTNRIVFVGSVYDIGYTGGLSTDHFKTPYIRWTGQRTPGVEIVATAAINLLSGDWLRRLPLWQEWVLVLGFGLSLGYLWCKIRPLTGVVLALSLSVLVAIIAMTSVWQTHVWFPWLVFSGVQIPLALGWSVLACKSAQAPPRTLSRRLPDEKPALSEQDQVMDMSVTVTAEQPAALAVANYTLLRQIGSGAYGEVWLGQDAVAVYRAIKIVHRRSFADTGPYDREFEGIRRFTPFSLQHPGLVQVLHVGREEERGYFYYVMELGDDERLGSTIHPDEYVPKTLDRLVRARGHLQVQEVVELGLALANALHFLHEQRLIHRDVKPANIIYVRGQPRLGDIGLVTVMADQNRQVSFLGTKGYMPPEGPGTAAGDVYSLGKLLYVAAVGCKVSEFPALPEDLEQRSDRAGLIELNEVILKACEPDTAARYVSASLMHQALQRISDH